MNVPKITFALYDTTTPGADPELVVAGIRQVRIWETREGKPLGRTMSEGFLGWILDLAHLAYTTKHGVPVTLDDFADRFEVEIADTKAPEASPVPFESATAPSSD